MPSATGRIAINAQTTDKVFLCLLQIDHPALGSPLRFVNDFQNCVSGGNTYLAYPFEITLPDRGGLTLPQVRLVIDNVDLRITDALKALLIPPTVTVSVVLASSPSTIESGPFVMKLRQVGTPDPGKIEGVLYYADLLNEPYPAGSFDPKTAPGLFKLFNIS